MDRNVLKVVAGSALLLLLSGCFGRGSTDVQDFGGRVLPTPTFPIHPDSPVTYDVLMNALLIPRCSRCHSDDFEDRNWVYDHVVPRRPDESELYNLVKSGKMPKKGARLTDQELDLVRRFIEDL